jgi:hypothetical protein
MRGYEVDIDRFFENYSTACSFNTDPQTPTKSHPLPTITPPAKGTVTPPAPAAKGKSSDETTTTKATPAKKPQEGNAGDNKKNGKNKVKSLEKMKLPQLSNVELKYNSSTHSRTTR